MRTAIDAAGRIVIPKEFRDRLRITRGRALEIRERDGLLEIEPAPARMSLVRKGRWWTAVAEEKLPPLTDDLVRETLERTRR
jgi:AbrB family looped-hinge helix DNA binding protein